MESVDRPNWNLHKLIYTTNIPWEFWEWYDAERVSCNWLKVASPSAYMGSPIQTDCGCKPADDNDGLYTSHAILARL